MGLSALQRNDMWHRWKAGQSLHEIGRAFGKEHSSIRCLVRRVTGHVLLARFHLSGLCCQLNRSMQRHPARRFEIACAGEPSFWLRSV